MSGSTPDNGLVNKLREAAWDEMRDSPFTHWSYADLPSKAKGRVDRTVAAVLMELAKSGQVAWAESLAGLAVVVEKGEHT